MNLVMPLSIKILKFMKVESTNQKPGRIREKKKQINLPMNICLMAIICEKLFSTVNGLVNLCPPMNWPKNLMYYRYLLHIGC